MPTTTATISGNVRDLVGDVFTGRSIRVLVESSEPLSVGTVPGGVRLNPYYPATIDEAGNLSVDVPVTAGGSPLYQLRFEGQSGAEVRRETLGWFDLTGNDTLEGIRGRTFTPAAVTPTIVSDVTALVEQAELARDAAQAVGTTNDTVIAGRLGDPTSASAAVAAANNESTTARFVATQLSGVAGTKLTIPTHVSPSGGETTHPSVVAFPQKWNGYRYWMAHTPYAAADVAQEDPNIVASQDGVTWAVPPGLTNPIQDAPGGTDYNSDTELIYGPDGKLWLFWRRVNTSLSVERVYLSKSSNGTTWSTPVIIQETSISPLPRLLSPTLIFEDGAWTMWGVNMNASPNTLVRYRSSGATLTSPTDWGAATTCTINGSIAGKEPWHVQVRKVGGQYVALLTVCDTATSGEGGQLQALVSDSGFTFTGGSKSCVPTINKNDHNRLYRASFVPEHVDGELVLRTWYSAVWSPPTGSTQWNIFATNIRGISTGGVETVTAGRPVPAGTPANRIIVRPKPGGAGEVARNNVTNPSPTTNINYWVVGFNGTGGAVTFTRETTGGPGPGKGANSWAKKVWTTAPTSNANYLSYGSNTLDNLTVTGGTTWTLSAWLYCSYAGAVSSIRVLFYDAAGATLNGGAEVQGMYYTHTAGQWERRHLITTTPAGAVRAAIRGYFQNVIPSVGAVTGMSSLYASAGDTIFDYHDGATSPDSKLTPAWLGTAYDSTSILTSAATYTQYWDGETAVSV